MKETNNFNNPESDILEKIILDTGGATITAVEILERSGLRTAMMQAVEAATVKCHSMGLALTAAQVAE